MSVGELAERAQISRRAVRFYVQEGLLPAPTGLGRGAFYTAEHLTLLERIRDLQASGLGLAAVRQRLYPSPSPSPSTSTSTSTSTSSWTRVVVIEGVELHVRGDVAVSPQILARAAASVRHALSLPSPDDPSQENPR